MQNSTAGFEFESILCFPNQKTPPSYFFVPLRVDLARDAAGSPTFTLLTVGSGGYLMLTAVWQTSDSSLESLRKEIAHRDQIADPATIRLSLAPLKDVKCELLLGDGSGQFQVVATSATSGTSPYAALFNLALNAEQFAAVTSALNGSPGRLVVEYTVRLITIATGSASLVPQSYRFSSWLQPYLYSGQAGLRTAIQEAIEEGLAKIQLDLPQNPSDQMVSGLYDRVLARAVELLPRLIGEENIGVTSDLEISVTLTEEVLQTFQPQVDLATLDLTKNRVMVAATPVGGLEGKKVQTLPLQVRLGFDPGGAPLAWVRVQKGEAETVLKSPGFQAAYLPGIPDAPLRITAGYTDGTPVFKKELAPTRDPEILLQPQDLGLTRVEVDARPLAQDQIRSARVWFDYNPPHRTSQQRVTLQFGNGKWIDYVWLATPNPASLRFLDYHWQAVGTDGHLINLPGAYNGTSGIVLSLSGGTTNVTNR